jgi:DnaK suppressor protein
MAAKKPVGRSAKARKPVAKKPTARRAAAAAHRRRPAKPVARARAAMPRRTAKPARSRPAPARRAAPRPAAARQVAAKHVAGKPVAPKQAAAKQPLTKHAAPKPAPAKPVATAKAPALIAPKAAPGARAAPRPALPAVKPALPPVRPVVLPSGRPATTPPVVRVRPGTAGTVVITTSRAQPRPSSADGEEEGADGSLSLLAGPRNVKPYLAKKGEQYMSKDQLEHFRTILLSWKRDLMEEVDRTVTHMKDEAANPPDPNDRATLESEFSLELRTRDRERKLIRKIDEALKRIEDGSYGYCLETGEEIGIKRLEARPVATLSIEAQERRERREKQYGDRDDRYR